MGCYYLQCRRITRSQNKEWGSKLSTTNQNWAHRGCVWNDNWIQYTPPGPRFSMDNTPALEKATSQGSGRSLPYTPSSRRSTPARTMSSSRRLLLSLSALLCRQSKLKPAPRPELCPPLLISLLGALKAARATAVLRRDAVHPPAVAPPQPASRQNTVPFPLPPATPHLLCPSRVHG